MEPMDKPDLHLIYATLDRHRKVLSEFQGVFEEAMTAAVGHEDPDGDGSEDFPGNGDDFELYDQATRALREAIERVSYVQACVAQQQGQRDFEVVPVA